ncbi:WecB/TagA/CpsF family glycosyltransferase [Alkalicaulis satelles]|uniref:WecB/TagA/CpsF family glycosyltransferase n=1 Tax=Alkalicaulis satelles TaxID=2609175 RepID=A0A5M6ZGS4_9PROT|nr:WecB/TagA/CpsF family glycosyltransferase [Alkalicaulis satelles]KAA5803929.1 WecB/TagA/CpsF family glycosyltransferase [Alkalicaulis satelles]
MTAPVTQDMLTGAAPAGRPAVERRVRERHVWFLNSAFDRIGFDTALERVAMRDPNAPFAFIVTPNVDHLVRLRRDGAFATLYAQAWLTVCDSRVLELIAALSGEDIDVTPGSDLAAALFETAIDRDEPVVVVGGSQAMMAGLKERYGLTDVRWHVPPMGLRHKPEAIAECAAFVAANPARFVFLCVGSPQQEMIAEACLNRGDCKGVGLCVGAALDFLSGEARRAPRWMQRARLEWLHRLLEEPGRMWKRYLVEGPKVLILWWEWRKARARLRQFERLMENKGF